MKLSKFFIVLFFMTISTSSFCREQHIFEKILASKQIGKTFKTATINDTTWRVYLGVLRDRHKKVKYYVIREFTKIKAAITWHGHSSIYFFNLQLAPIAEVHVAMLDNLPYKLDHNTFYFKYIENGIAKDFEMTMPVPLSKEFCSRQNECNEILTD